MPQQNFSQARAGVSVVNTQIAQGFKDAALVGMNLFPRVDVGQRAGRILTFPPETFRQYTNLNRSPGSDVPRVQFGYSSGEYSLLDFAIEGSLPQEIREEQQSLDKGFTIDGATMAVNGAMKIIARRLEIAQANLATTAANYDASNKITLSGTSQFSDSASNPVKIFSDAAEAIRAQTGANANVAIMGRPVFNALKFHPSLIDRIKYTGRDSLTEDLMASLLDIPKIIVADVAVNDDSDVRSYLWGKNVVIAYTVPGTVENMGEPTYGYTYNYRGYPMAQTPYYDDPKRTWAFPVTACEQPIIAAKAAGYLISSAVA